MKRIINIGQKIRKTLTKKGLKKRQAACYVDISESGFYSRMRGEIPWRLHELQGLAEMMDLSLTELLDGATYDPK